MYGRKYGNHELTFEASGGLINASLVLQDRETDTYWSIMAGKAISGLKAGTQLKELSLGKKMRWADWKKMHPDTRVLSVYGQEDSRDSYKDYWKNQKGYRGIAATDKRMKTKEPIFAFKLDGVPYAVAQKKLTNGVSFKAGDLQLFFYRGKKDKLFASTAAFSGSNFIKKGNQWVDAQSDCIFDASAGRFSGTSGRCPTPLTGFDTFWYNWSLNNPETKILGE